MPRIEVSAGDGPGTHAFVVGVSRYRHVEGGEAPTDLGESFGLEPLTAAARSASEFARWLLDRYHREETPLRTLHVALSPSDGEELDDAVLARLPADRAAAAATRATVENDLKGFVRECASDPENVGIVYVAGHGVQLTKHGAVVLLEDFAAPEHLNELDGAIDMAGCHAGMNHPATAGTQFWFVDACRQRPAVAQRFETMVGALSLSERRGAVSVTSPLLLAASTREAAFARTGETTLFGQALLWALDGGAAAGPNDVDDGWHVSVMNLLSRIDRKVEALAGRFGEEQHVDPTGRVKDAVVHRFREVPAVDLSVRLAPEAARAVADARLFRDARDPVDATGTEWPRRWRVDAGLYVLDIEAPPPFHSWTAILQLEPPEQVCDVEVG
ncbi:MAG: caspase family protein [Planctomycetota bacterium JB042]